MVNTRFDEASPGVINHLEGKSATVARLRREYAADRTRGAWHSKRALAERNRDISQSLRRDERRLFFPRDPIRLFATRIFGTETGPSSGEQDPCRPFFKTRHRYVL